MVELGEAGWQYDGWQRFRTGRAPVRVLVRRTGTKIRCMIRIPFRSNLFVLVLPFRLCRVHFRCLRMRIFLPSSRRLLKMGEGGRLGNEKGHSVRGRPCSRGTAIRTCNTLYWVRNDVPHPPSPWSDPPWHGREKYRCLSGRSKEYTVFRVFAAGSEALHGIRVRVRSTCGGNDCSR